jgi:hypothetical protein
MNLLNPVEHLADPDADSGIFHPTKMQQASW